MCFLAWMKVLLCFPCTEGNKDTFSPIAWSSKVATESINLFDLFDIYLW